MFAPRRGGGALNFEPAASASPSPSPHATRADSGLLALAAIAGYYRIAADPFQMAHDMGLGERSCTPADIVRAAMRIGLKASVRRQRRWKDLLATPLPAVLALGDGSFRLLLSRLSGNRLRLVDPVTRAGEAIDEERLKTLGDGDLILVTRRWRGAGMDPGTFGFRWFLPSLWRYRRPLAQVLIASLTVQLFALATPLLFQVIIDKVLVHKGFSTLTVIAIGLAGIALFDAVMQLLRTYTLTHTTSRIDVELGSRLFDHLLRLPLAYFESRPTGQTVARVRELETIRSFLTGQGLFSVIDLVFAVVFIAVLFYYSVFLTLIALISLPVYILIASLVRPPLRAKINDRFNTGAASQQFLVESVFGIETLKAAAVEPMLRNEWEEKLAAYVKSSFHAVILSAIGQNAIGLVNKLTTVAVLFFGARAVIDNELSLGGLIAFNMILNQATAPILRLSQLWQDFQQVKISVERIGDILNAPPEAQRLAQAHLPAARGSIAIAGVTFRYRPDAAEVLRDISLEVPAGKVIGFYGPSGSGKSTLTKLIQRLYRPERGQILIDGIDIGQVDVAWLRRQIGVVLQENTLFNRTVHENIALANPGAGRASVIATAKLAGADEFIAKLPLGYDTIIEERGANLSGGQRQRIALARALATQPRILILDEATSALDLESERIIRRNMRQIAKGRTVLIIAHRLVALRGCDRLYGIEGGRIVEQGTHKDLIAKPDGLYARLWRIQVEDTE
ncbi:MAG: type I secretion system permease/ATPase [Hyphomicrobiaceae bacterium]|nr:MAG: type I secretion system permease/ATPase [Hyphomicrobiaceae bacterium]